MFVIVALTVLLIVNVGAREVGRSLYFAEEISTFFVIFITLVGLSYGVRKARHIRMAAFFDLMNEKTKKVLVFITSGVGTLVMFFMAWQSVLYMLNAFHSEYITPALLLPYWIFLAIVPVGFSLAGINHVLTIARNISSKEVWLSAEQKSEYAA